MGKKKLFYFLLD